MEILMILAWPILIYGSYKAGTKALKKADLY